MNKNVLQVTAIVLAVIAILALYDYNRSKQFTIEVMSIEPQPAMADGRSPVTMKVRVTKSNGEPAQGHDLYAVALAGGNFQANRVRTDAKGEATFVYFPYMATSVQKASDVPIEIRDESNSVFFEINTIGTAVIKLKEPEGKGAKSEFNLEDIFGESNKDEGEAK